MATEGAWFEASEPKWAPRRKTTSLLQALAQKEPQESREGLQNQMETTLGTAGPSWCERVKQ